MYRATSALTLKPPGLDACLGTRTPFSFTGLYLITRGSGSSVDIATELRAGLSGIESRSVRDFPSIYTGPGAHAASCKIGTKSFPGLKCCRGVLLTTHPLLVEE